MKPPFSSFGRTKIVCSLGPVSRSPHTIRALLREGMDVSRINFSHGTYDEHRRTLKNLRLAARATRTSLCVMQDLQGPKIRIGDIGSASIVLKPRQAITIIPGAWSGREDVLPTTYELLAKDVKPGGRILIDDGRVELKVTAIHRNRVQAKVITGGTISSHKGLNLPGTRVSAPSLTAKDKADVIFGIKHGVDYIALSFVRRPEDVVVLRKFIRGLSPGRHLPIISKIETKEAVQNIDGIIHEADVVMVARGDLGVELTAEEVPIVQKTIVRKCNELGKPVIIATQMLESMINNPTPTRAEATDVANAVLDGADALLLSEETSVGKHPVDAVRVMERIIHQTEAWTSGIRHDRCASFPSTHPYDPLCLSASQFATRLGATAIVALTHSGATALRVAKFRPASPIVAITGSETVARCLNLVWGMRALVIDNLKRDTDKTFRRIEDRLVAAGIVHRGDTVIMVAGIPLFEGHPTNMIKADIVR